MRARQPVRIRPREHPIDIRIVEVGANLTHDATTSAIPDRIGLLQKHPTKLSSTSQWRPEKHINVPGLEFDHPATACQ